MNRRRFLSTLRRRTRSIAAAVDAKLDRRAGRERAILVGDAAGFTRAVHEHGILQFLAVMTRCYDRIIPLLERGGGRVLSARADNLLAVFETPEDAVGAAVRVQGWLRRQNRGRRREERLRLCVGIDVGRVIELEDDVYGAAVNVASKLGEDLASADEILVTGAVAGRVKLRYRASYARSAEIGGRLFELYRIRP